MDFLRQSIDIIWNRIPVESYIDGYMASSCPEVDVLHRHFDHLLVDCYEEVTLEEANGIEKQLIENWLYDERHGQGESFFNVLIHFANAVLSIDNDEPICRYVHLLRWWETSQLVGPDMLSSAFLAHHDLHANIDRKSFMWPPVLRHDNAALNAMLNKGLVELHAHLNGSSFNFDLQWLSLMNDPSGRGDTFRKLGYKSSQIIDLKPDRKLYDLHDLVVYAAELRRWLYVNLVEHQESALLLDIAKELPRTKITSIKEAISAERYMHAHRFSKPHDFKCESVDYAIDRVLPYHQQSGISFVNSILQGERRILYHALRYIYGSESSVMRDKVNRNLLLYTVIKCMLRNQLIQINDRKGFDNFRQYQDDKELFIKQGSIYDVLLKDLAFKNIFCNTPVRYLEYRIAPKNTPGEMVSSIAQIKQLDNSSYLQNDVIQAALTKGRKYAIVHFIKHGEKSMPLVLERNHRLRNEIKEKGIALKTVYQNSQLLRENLCAIDAANAERAARPEVFAHLFRYLLAEMNNYTPSMDDRVPRHSIHVTYHVGEDFWDVLDGLRAIDEALIFLNMKDGDRLGHALALGTDAERYYQKRHYSVIMPQHVMLDNMVWLYSKAPEYGVTLPPTSKRYIEDQIDELSRRIYGDRYFSPRVQYQAWLLRGDNKDALDMPMNLHKVGWHRYDLSRQTRERYADSCIPSEVKECLYAYHSCRENGDKMITLRFDKPLISVITDLQNRMMEYIGRKHISIETNPTSNRRIGDFTRYDQHPIFRFLNKVPVSINTDDLGVFDTSLYNEYSLLACAMEKDFNPDGTSHYDSPQAIYRILDEIREQSFSQCFVTK